MITFEPETPWEVGQEVTLHHPSGWAEVKVVESVDRSDSEAQYTLVDKRAWGLRQQGVRPYIELG